MTPSTTSTLQNASQSLPQPEPRTQTWIVYDDGSEGMLF